MRSVARVFTVRCLSPGGLSVARLIAAPSRPRVMRSVSLCPRRVSVATGGQPAIFNGALTLATAPLWAVKLPRTAWRGP